MCPGGVVEAQRPSRSGARAPRPRLIEQSIEPLLSKPAAPHHRHVARDPKPLGDLGVLQAVGRKQDNPRALRERLRARSPPRPRLQLRALVIGQLNPNSNIRWHNPSCPLRKI
jgi:hypothetical protein